MIQEETLQEKVTSINKLLNLLVQKNYGINEYEQISSIISFINHTISDYNPSNIKEKVVLLIGPTGGGKSTVLNYIAGKELYLEGYETGMGLSCKDPVSPIGRGTSSTTFIPNITNISKDDNYSFIDCAGDFDTNGTVKECLNSLIKQKIAHIAKEIKIVIVCTQASLTAEGSYGAVFKAGLENSAKFLGNINDFKENICLVVTHCKRNREILVNIKNSLHAILNQDGNPMGEYKDTLSFVTDNDRFIYFVNPSEEGSSGDVYSEPAYLQDQRQLIRDLINVKTGFKKDISSNQYFKVTYSQEVKDTMEKVLGFINQRSIYELKQYFSTLTNNDKIKIDLENIEKLVAFLKELGSFTIDKPITLSKYLAEIHKDAYFSQPNSNDTEQFEKLIGQQLFITNFTTKSIESDWGKDISIGSYIDPIVSEINSIVTQTTGLYSLYDGVVIIGGFNMKSSQINVICASNPTFKDIRVYSLSSIEFDQDMVLPGKNLSIVSNHWKISSPVKVDLSGIHCTTYPDNKQQADKTSNVPGSKGNDGKPGLPGGSSGHFLGSGFNFSSLSNLSVYCNGGNGGNGQRGCDGNKGQDRDFSISDGQVKGQTYSGNDGLKKVREMFGSRAIVSPTDTSGRYSFTVNGGAGGAYGMTGAKGLAGFNGTISLYNISTNQDVSSSLKDKQSNVGKEGIDGGATSYGKKGDGKNVVYDLYTNYISYGARSSYGYNEFSGVKLISSSILPDNSSSSSNSPTSAGRVTPTISPFNSNDIQTRFAKYMIAINSSLSHIDIIGSKFIKDIDQNQSQFKFGTISDLISKAVALEENFPINQPNNENYIEYFRTLKDSISNYFKVNKITKPVDVKLLNFIYSLACSSIVRINTSNETALVVDITKFFDQVQIDINDLDKSKTIQVKQMYTKNYENSIKKYMDEANDSVKLMLNDIDSFKKTIDDSLVGMMNEIEELLKDAVKNEIKLNEAKVRLGQALQVQAATGFLKVVGSSLGFLGPVGTAAGGIINSACDITQGFFPADGTPGKMTLPDSIGKNISSIQTSLKTEQTYNDREIKRQMDIFDYEIAISKLKNDSTYVINKPPVEDIVKRWTERANEYKEFTKGDPNYLKYCDMAIDMEKKDTKPDAKLIKDLENEKEAHKLIYQQLEKKEMNEKMNGNDKLITTLDKVAIGVNVAKTLLDSVNAINITVGKIQMIEAEITKNRETMKLLMNKEDSVVDFNNKIVSDLVGNIDSFADGLENKSHVRLDVEKWNLKQYLNSIKSQFTDFSKGFKAEGQLLASITRLSEGFDVVIGIYDKVQSYQDQIEFTNFISSISSTDVFNDIPDQYKVQMQTFTTLIKRNVVIEQYQKGMKAFIQWSFPFFGHYASELTENDLSGEKSFFDPLQRIIPSDDIIPKIVKIISSITKKVKESEYLVTPKIDNILFNSKFEHVYPHSPFFTWPYVEYSYEIDKVLNGDTGLFVPVIQDTVKEAIKFSLVGINFEHSDSEKNISLQEILHGFQVKMVHSGISYYNYDTQLFQISSNGPNNEKLELIYQYFDIFNKDSIPSDSFNETFKKLSKNVPVLSPYTTWSISLSPIDTLGAADAYDKLKTFVANEKLHISMNLIGFGSYVEDTKKTLKITDFYKKYLTN